MTKQKVFILMAGVVSTLSFGGCLHRAPAEVFSLTEYSRAELPLSAEAQKARDVAVSNLVRESRIDTSEFTITVLQDSVNFVVDFRPIRTSRVDSTGTIWVEHRRGYSVIVRKSDLSIVKTWVSA